MTKRSVALVLKNYSWTALYFLLLVYILSFQNLILPRLGHLHAGHGVLKGDNDIFYHWAIQMAEDIRKSGWSQWKLYIHTAAGINVSLASILFLFIGPSISTMAPINCLLHIGSAFLLLQILKEFGFESKKAFWTIFFFIFAPTSLLWVSQLHKDLYTIIGWFCFLLSLIYILKEKNYLQSFILISATGISFLLVRPLYLNLLLLLAGLFFVLLMFQTEPVMAKLKKIAMAFIILSPIFASFYFFYSIGISHADTEDKMILNTTTMMNQKDFCSQYKWVPTPYLPQFIDNKIMAIATVRNRQICNMPPNIHSNIDLDFIPESSTDIFKYIPRASLVALTAPWPGTLFKINNSESRIIFFEMSLYYVGLFFLLIRFFTKRSYLEFSIFVVCLGAMCFFALSSPNLGTLHRVRFPFFALFAVMGFAHLSELFRNGWKPLARKIVNRGLKLRILLLKQLKLSKIYKTTPAGLEKNITSVKSLEIVLFSKDRPLQLLALLESLNHFSEPKILPHIIYNAKDEEYEQAYRSLFKEYSHLFKAVHADKVLGFRTTLINLIEELQSDNITFLVDDIILKNNLQWNELLIFNTSKVTPTIRLAPHLSRCYTTNDEQTLPAFIRWEKLNWWYWDEGDHDWHYPLSVDGNIFSREEFLTMTKNIPFKAPNTLELNLQIYKKDFIHRLGCCYDESVIINVPVNKVQDEISNIHGSVHQSELLEIWNKNLKINFIKLAGFQNISCHQEVEFEMIPREKK